MSIKFTPGPWSMKPQRVLAVVPIVDATGRLIATTSSGHGEKNRRETNISNARLIAAAPDLLFTLQRVLDNGGCIDDDLWNRMREVIAAAKGDAA